MRPVLLFCLALFFAPPVQAATKVENVTGPAHAAVNAIRAKHGLPALQPEARLTNAAAGHAADMIRKRFFSHTGSNGSSIGDRARGQNYRFCMVSENIAKGHPRMEQVLAAWMRSPGHRRNILHADARDFALVRGSGNIWVMMLGGAGC